MGSFILVMWGRVVRRGYVGRLACGGYHGTCNELKLHSGSKQHENNGLFR